MTDPGHVHDIRTGHRIGKTRDLWATFLENAERQRRRGPCYVVADLADVPWNVEQRLGELGVPIIDEEAFRGRGAILVEGDSSEWEDEGEA